MNAGLHPRAFPPATSMPRGASQQRGAIVMPVARWPSTPVSPCADASTTASVALRPREAAGTAPPPPAVRQDCAWPRCARAGVLVVRRRYRIDRPRVSTSESGELARSGSFGTTVAQASGRIMKRPAQKTTRMVVAMSVVLALMSVVLPCVCADAPPAAHACCAQREGVAPADGSCCDETAPTSVFSAPAVFMSAPVDDASGSPLPLGGTPTLIAPCTQPSPRPLASPPLRI